MRPTWRSRQKLSRFFRLRSAPWLRLGLLAGLVAPPLLVGSTVLLTILDHEYLHDQGWSAVQRNEVQWPSLLMLGPHGHIAIAVVAVSGVLFTAFAVALANRVQATPVRVVAMLLGIAGVSLCLVAFPPDSPGHTAPASWHHVIHNIAYPFILATCLAAVVVTWTYARRDEEWRVMEKISATVFLVAVVALATTLTESAAQLGRYFLFSSLLVWVTSLALTVRRTANILRRRTSL